MLDVEFCLEGLKVQENEDNFVVVYVVCDIFKFIWNKFLLVVCLWIQCFICVGIYGGCLKCVIDLKVELEFVLRKYKELDIEFKGGQRYRMEVLGYVEEDEDDEDFVEVFEKEGYEFYIFDYLCFEYGLEVILENEIVVWGLWIRMRKDEEVLDFMFVVVQLWWFWEYLLLFLFVSFFRVLLELQEVQKLVVEWVWVFVVFYGVDLYYWGQEFFIVGKIFKFDFEYCFWKFSEVEEEVVNVDVFEMFWSCYIIFVGRFEFVQYWCCVLRLDGWFCEC